MSQLIYYTEINVACIIILAVLMITQISTIHSDKRSPAYFGMLVSSILFCVFDIAAAAFRGQMFEGARTLVWISNILYNSCLMTIGFLWILYVTRTLKLKHPRIYVATAGVIAFAVILLNFLTPFNGLLFTVDANNLYVRGPHIWINFAFVIPAELFPVFLTLISKASKKEKIAICLYPIAPLIAAILQASFYGISAGQVGITISLLIVYIVIQNYRATEQALKLKIFNEICNTDVLTKLNNRRAYNENFEKGKSYEWIGCVFFDINGLKKTNDEYGHEAGDRLIQNFAAKLIAIFPKEEVHRISGDEFVVLTTDPVNFKSRLGLFGKRNNDSSSYGYAAGAGSDIEDLVREAEANMYKDKGDYYARTGIDRRR